jgi:hypothetical protein
MPSERLEAFVRREFPAEDAAAVIDRLDQLALSNAEKQSLERIQAAIVLLTKADFERFDENVRLAEKDWRDALVFSGLGKWRLGAATRRRARKGRSGNARRRTRAGRS